MKSYCNVPWHVECMNCSINLGPYDDDKLIYNSSVNQNSIALQHFNNGHTLRVDARESLVSQTGFVHLTGFTCIYKIIIIHNSN